VTSCAGWRSFINSPKYRPAGPPPMQTMFMRALRGSMIYVFVVQI
jgi:hypothetical protein